MSIELQVENLQSTVNALLSSQAHNRAPSWHDLDQLSNELKSVKDKLKGLSSVTHHDITVATQTLESQLSARMNKADHNIVKGVGEAVADRFKVTERDFSEQLKASSMAAASSAADARAVVMLEINKNLELIRNASFIFAHGE
jgi:hypothetical protein